MRKQKITYRIFIGDRPIEDLTEAEREAFEERTVQRMGAALNDYFSQHPEEFKKL